MNLFHSQLFLDDAWIADSIRVGRVWHQAKKRCEPVLQAEEAWEGGPVMYGSVLHHQGMFRAWYIGWRGVYRGFICYAESADGLRWVKPKLGLVEINGSKANNVILAAPELYVDNLGVIDDSGDRAWPLKMIYWTKTDAAPKGRPGYGLSLARSKDGLHWDFSPGMILPGWGDRTNVLPVRDGGKYVIHGRIPSMLHSGYRCRTVSRTESRDLVHWAPPELVLKPDPEDEPHMEIYSASLFPYEGMYLGFIERMHMAPDVLDPEIWWSRDKRRWQRSRTRPAFIERGPKDAWDSAWVNLPSSGPIRRGDELLFHYSGRSAAHGQTEGVRFAGIGLASLRIDGFCSLQAKEREGWLVTPPMTWVKGELALNADARRDITTHPTYGGGSVLVEVRDPAGKPLRGFSFDDCTPITNNTLRQPDSIQTIVWKFGRKMRSLAGRKIRLAFRLRDAHLYSFKAMTSQSKA